MVYDQMLYIIPTSIALCLSTFVSSLGFYFASGQTIPSAICVYICVTTIMAYAITLMGDPKTCLLRYAFGASFYICAVWGSRSFYAWRINQLFGGAQLKDWMCKLNTFAVYFTQVIAIGCAFGDMLTNDALACPKIVKAYSGVVNLVTGCLVDALQFGLFFYGMYKARAASGGGSQSSNALIRMVFASFLITFVSTIVDQMRFFKSNFTFSLWTSYGSVYILLWPYVMSMRTKRLKGGDGGTKSQRQSSANASQVGKSTSKPASTYKKGTTVSVEPAPGESAKPEAQEP
jgi:hypothetical protein